ncbi:MAG: pilus assembly protein CpaE [Kineosporiaceae bacterium]|nr:pilus assembly protein CpaE [Kineosporiaceae bacterium]MBK7625207.1 pilus assembly protein CpaE [Kineosporiaceae bacterium]MBK8076413.1 pilus assembly protein CpaE [Kineosporiaceae bacterium]
MGITVAQALALRAAGLRWTPAAGDRFVLPHRDMDGDVFVLSDMTVQVHEFPTGAVIGFNGVAEWALDSVQAEEALWLPAEHQLRDLLGGLFIRLIRADGDYVVTVRTPDGERDHAAADAAQAYAAALLAVLAEL